MTIDTQLRSDLTAAVDHTTVPPGLAGAALAGGRRRRRRRTAGAVALAGVAVVAGGTLLLPGGGPRALDRDVAGGGGGTGMDAAGLAWARSLPEGADPALPFFGADGSLWSDGQRHDVPASVNRTVPPRAVANGWLVMTGDDETGVAFALLGPDGSLRTLPVNRTSAGTFLASSIAVSADGTKVALGDWLVDLTTMAVTDLPHAPSAEAEGGYATEIRVVGFTPDGLVYEGAPFKRGFGTTWLLRDDGTTVEVEPPGSSHVGQDDPADLAVAFDYADDSSDTCVTSYALRDASWVEAGTGCMGQYLGEALASSPGHEWLLTDDLPRVWNLAEGAWDRVDMPDGIGAEQMMAQGGGAVWESDDAFLLPVADRWTGSTSPEPTFDQVVQVVRCSLATGACERAGAEQRIPVSSTMWGSTELRFAAQ